MVRAILAGRKTQTRRVIKPQLERMQTSGGVLFGWLDDHWHGFKNPYGWPGNRLWVRETWSEHPDGDGIIYRASDPGWDDEKTGLRWHPSIHMPRWASRITLEVTRVWVERIQKISLEDVKAEGIGAFIFAKGVLSETPPDPRWKFIELWDSINAKRGYGWGINPWVWEIEFKRTT